MEPGDERIDEDPPTEDPPTERTHPVRGLHWALGIVGRVLITLGLLIIAFVGYQLWGTGIEFRANQLRIFGRIRFCIVPTRNGIVDRADR